MKFERALSAVNAFTRATNGEDRKGNKALLTQAYDVARTNSRNGYVFFEHNGQRMRIDMKRRSKNGWFKGYTFNVRYVTTDNQLEA